MSKELEAFIKIRDYVIEIPTKPEDRYADYICELLEKVEKALTPPTEQEVCQALKKEMRQEIIYNPLNKIFVYVKEGKTITNITSFLHNPKELMFNDYFPPHLITLIGRFYEGMKNDI